MEPGRYYSTEVGGPNNETSFIHIFPNRTAHVDQIHRLRWHDGDLPGQSMLASCSEDGTIRVLIVQSAIE